MFNSPPWVHTPIDKKKSMQILEFASEKFSSKLQIEMINSAFLMLNSRPLLYQNPVSASHGPYLRLWFQFEY